MSGIRAITESLILTVVVAAANALFGASDPGWLSLNPTPYVVVPVLVGMRYGFVPGFVAGLIAASAVALGASIFGGQPLADVVAGSTFTLFALVALGLVAGEVYRTIFSRSENFSRRAESLEGDVVRLNADLALAHEAQGQLQEQLALRGAKFSAADVELNKLFEAGAGPVLPGTLAALDDLCEMGASAFYRLGANKRLNLECARGDIGQFPETLEGDDAAIVHAAIEGGKLATCRGAMDGELPKANYLAALPLAGDEGLVLVVGDMPFAAMNWQNLARAEVFCCWVAEKRRDQGAASVVLDESALRERVDLAAKTGAEQGLPTTVMLFTAAAGIATGLDQVDLQSAVLPVLQGAEVVGTVSRGEPHLVVLLPMGGSRQAGILAESAGESLDSELFLIRSEESAEEIWKLLTNVA